MTIYHDYIAPWFDRFIQLPEGNLRSSIEKLANSLEFPLTKILVIEGSKRSAHSNAYFFGFFKNKRVVLFDTLLKESPFEKEKKEAVLKDKEHPNEEGTASEGETASDGALTNEANGEDKPEKVEDMKHYDDKAEKDGLTPKEAEERCEKKRGKGCSDQEILAVLGHEFGHWKMNHTIKHMVIGQVKYCSICASL